MIIHVPIGTMVYDLESGEIIRGHTSSWSSTVSSPRGFSWLGNTRYKSSINRAPRQTTQGTPGETRQLRLELRVLADVGLLGCLMLESLLLFELYPCAKPKVVIILSLPYIQD